MVQWAVELETLANLPVLSRARGSITFALPDGVKRSDCVGKRIHYLSPAEQWEPIDTALSFRAGADYYSGFGTPARIAGNGEASIDGGVYRQRTLRVGLFRPSTSNILGAVNVPVGRTVAGDSLVAAGMIGGVPWEHRLRVIEDGLRETLTLFDRPTIPGVQANDWLVLETMITGTGWPDGWMDTEYQQEGMHFSLPSAADALGNRPPQTRRFARTVAGVQYLYTGVPVSWLADPARVWPVIIDPDYAGDTADGYIYGESATYATARATSFAHAVDLEEVYPGQRLLTGNYACFRVFLKFATAAIPDTDTITQVNLKATCRTDVSTTDFDVQIVKQDWSAQDPLSAGNREAAYDNCLAGTADSSIWRNTSGIVLDTQYASGNLDTTWVNKTGNTYYSLRSSRDFDSTAPTGNEYVGLGAQEQPTAGYRPVLTVLHSAGGNVTATPGVLAMSTATFAPTVSASDHKTVTPGVLAHTLSAFAPSANVSDNQTATPGVLALALSTFAPAVTTTANVLVTAITLALSLSTYEPVITAIGEALGRSRALIMAALGRRR